MFTLKPFTALAAIGFLLLAGLTPVFATSDTWDGSVDGVWATTNNWLTDLTVPGAGDTATFNGLGNGNRTIDLGGGVTISNVTFDTAGVAAYTIGSGAVGSQTLVLTQANGGITMSSTVASNQLFNANLALATTGTYFVTNESASTLTLAGGIAPVTTGIKVFRVAGVGNTTITGVISNSVAANTNLNLAKTGSGTLLLSGGGGFTGNGIDGGNGTFPAVLWEGTTRITGGTYVIGGELVVGGILNDVNGGSGWNVNLTMGGGSLTVNGFISLARGNGLGVVSSDLVLSNSAAVTAQNLGIGFNNGFTSNLPKGSLTMSSNSTFTISGAARNVNIAETTNSTATVTLNGTAIFNAGDSTAKVGQGGSGTLTLNDSSQFTLGTANRLFTVGTSAGGVGVVTLNGSSIFTHTVNNITSIGEAGIGTFNIASTNATANVRNLVIGRATGGLGVVYNKGTILGISDGIYMGDGANSYSYFLNDNGNAPVASTNANNIDVGINAGNVAVFDVLSGKITGNFIRPGRNNVNASVSQINVSGGTLGAIGAGNSFYVGENTAGANKWVNVNVTGGLFSITNTMNLSLGNTALNTSIVSVVTSGILSADTITAAGTSPQTFLNFNNGTLRANAGIAAALVNANITRVTTYSGGMTVDTAGFNKTIDVPVVGPVADGLSTYGVTNITLSGTGTGYKGRPVVKIIGDGTGASAIADFNPATGLVTGVTLTSAGSGYTVAPTVSLSGGGGSALTATAAINGVASGGLTKTGAGTLTLNGGYTYQGPTLVSGGTLSLNAAGTTPTGAGNLTVSNASLTLALNGGLSTIPASNVTFRASSVLNLNYGSVSGAPVTAINASTNLVQSGSTVINITGTGLGTGVFPLITYTGASVPTNNFTLGSLPPGVTAVLTNSGGNTLSLLVTVAGQLLTWYGADSLGTPFTTWNLNTSTNWNTGTAKYFQYNGNSFGDNVTFDDTLFNFAGTNVTLNSVLVPATVNFNSTLPYSLTGSGSIGGVTSVNITNTGSVFIGTSNSYLGGTVVGGGTLIITNNSALGTNTGPVSLAGGNLQLGATLTSSRSLALNANASIAVSAGATGQWSGVISGGGILSKTGNGTLTLSATNTQTGNVWVKGGTMVVDSGGSISNNTWNSIGQAGSDVASMTLKGSGSFITTADFNIADIDSTTGTLNIQDSATLTANNLFVSSANSAGSTANGTMNQTGGTVTQVSTTTGTFAIGGRRDTANDPGAFGVYNMSSGTLVANAGIRVGGNGTGTINQSGGFIQARQGINIARIVGSTGTNNLNGGTLESFNVASSTGVNAIFNFNGGTLKAYTNNATFFQGLTRANVRDGGAVIDSTNFGITIVQPLLQSDIGGDAGTGGLTKLGLGALTLTGSNNYNGMTIVSAGSLLVTPAHQTPGAVSVANAATYGIQLPGVVGASTNSSLTLAAGATTLSFGFGTNGNTAAALLVTGPFTNSGTLSVTMSGISSKFTLGATPLLKYGAGSVIGTLNPTIAGPQGMSITLSNGVASSTLYAVITSLGSGITWTGTNPVLTNVWDLNLTTNWLVGSSPTRYTETIPPGDAVTFNDGGTGLVLLSNTASPSSMLVSNNSVNYTFQGSGHVSGPMGLTKLGTGIATMAFAGNDYQANTVVSNGTLRLGVANAIPDGTGKGNVIINGTLDLNTFSDTINGLSGSGTVDTVAGGTPRLTIGNNNVSSTFAGMITNSSGTLALTKLGTGTQTLSGPKNYGGSTLVHGGTLNLTGSPMTNGGLIAVVDNNADGTKAVMNIASDISALQLWLGDRATNDGAVYQTAGTVTLTQGSSVDNLRIGSVNNGGKGYYKLSGGSISANEIGIGAGIATSNTVGVVDITSGIMTSPGWLTVGRGAGTSSGILNVSGSGQVVLTSALDNTRRLRLNWATVAGAQSIVTVSSGGQIIGPALSTYTLDLSGANVAGTLGEVNINSGGLIQIAAVTGGNANPDTLLNFNGGTLKATVANASFIADANIDGIYVYTNGANIDDNGVDITVSRPLLAPTDLGVTNIDIADGGTGYIGAPMVAITGGTGIGATAVANMVDDGTANGTFKVASLTITCPGVYSSDPITVTFTGGGAITPATPGAITTAANVSGGLTKKGTGKLILSSANTYAGNTVVSNGTLQVDGSIVGPVTVKSGATLGGNGIVGGVVTVQAGGALGAGASIGFLTLNSSPVLNGSVIVEVDRNGGAPVADLIHLPGSPITYGGTLVVSNVGVALVLGDTFTNFTATGHSGSFATITGSPLDPGLGYSFTNGVLSVVAVSTVASNPTNITSVVSGNSLTLSWPSDHLGWLLQSQTNSRAVGLKTNWFDVAGSDTITNTVITMDKVSPTVFFRLRHP